MNQKQIWNNLPHVNVIPKHMDMFWKFVAERQAIWYRRFVKKQPPPWTNDRILRNYKFTNVYRELDHGTLWYLGNVLPMARRGNGRYDKGVNLLWLTVMYRLLNRADTFEDVRMPPYHRWKALRGHFQKALMERKAKGLRVFTNAHLTLPTNELGGSKIKRYVQVLDETYKILPGLWLDITLASSLEEVFDLLRKLPCVGRFISYEICCDLMLVKAIRFTEDDWVNPGPGCKRGLNLIFPLLKTVEEYQKGIAILRDQQETYFALNHCTFHMYKHRMTLRGIEHSLCEFQKYFKMLHSVGKQRMKFVPRDWGQLKLKF